MRYFLLFVLLASLTVACESVVFTETQPQGIAPQSQFPQALLGVYVADKDTLYLEADGYRVTDETTRRIALNELDSAEFHINSNGDINPLQLKGVRNFHIATENDTLIYQSKRWEETRLSDSLKLTSWKGYHFLNTQTDDGWEVYLMKVQPNGDLFVRGIDAEDEVSLLQQTMEVDTVYEADSESIDHLLVTPSKKQL
ncbi:MAG: hypothetical protein AAF399_12590, partial [Bacteroidota bacterium]